MNVGPMVNGYDGRDLAGAGMVAWKATRLHGAGKIDSDQMVDMISTGSVFAIDVRSKAPGLLT